MNCDLIRIFQCLQKIWNDLKKGQKIQKISPKNGERNFLRSFCIFWEAFCIPTEKVLFCAQICVQQKEAILSLHTYLYLYLFVFVLYFLLIFYISFPISFVLRNIFYSISIAFYSNVKHVNGKSNDDGICTIFAVLTLLIRDS